MEDEFIFFQISCSFNHNTVPSSHWLTSSLRFFVSCKSPKPIWNSQILVVFSTSPKLSPAPVLSFLDWHLLHDYPYHHCPFKFSDWNFLLRSWVSNTWSKTYAHVFETQTWIYPPTPIPSMGSQRVGHNCATSLSTISTCSKLIVCPPLFPLDNLKCIFRKDFSLSCLQTHIPKDGSSVRLHFCTCQPVSAQ